jgi:hypothetical protein
MSRLSIRCGSLDLSHPYGPSWPVIGTALPKSSKLYYDRQAAGQSVWEQSTHLGLTTRSWLLSDSCGFVDLGHPLWQEDRSAVCNCYCPSPLQSFSGPSPVGLVAIFCCLRFETFLFVASYNSQGHGGGIRPRLHMDDSFTFFFIIYLYDYFLQPLLTEISFILVTEKVMPYAKPIFKDCVLLTVAIDSSMTIWSSVCRSITTVVLLLK